MVPVWSCTERPPGDSGGQPGAQGGQRGKAGGKGEPGTFRASFCLRSLPVLSLMSSPRFALLMRTHSSDLTQLSLLWEGSLMAPQTRSPLPSKPAPALRSPPATSMGWFLEPRQLTDGKKKEKEVRIRQGIGPRKSGGDQGGLPGGSGKTPGLEGPAKAKA